MRLVPRGEFLPRVGVALSPEVLERVYGVPVGVRQIDGRPLALYYA